MTDALIGIVSGGLALMLVHWMQPGHIFDFVPKWVCKVPEGLTDQQTIDYYWENVSGNWLLRVCICETCLSVYVFFAMFGIFGEYSVLSFLIGLAATYLTIRYAD